MLTSLLLLQGYAVLLSSAAFLPASPLPPLSYAVVASLMSSVLSRLRPDVVALTDAFALPDFVLGPLGRRDGCVYEALYEAVRGDGSGENGKSPYWDDLVKPMLTEPNLRDDRCADSLALSPSSAALIRSLLHSKSHYRSTESNGAGVVPSTFFMRCS